MTKFLTRGQLIAQHYNSRGSAWRTAFVTAIENGADRYRAAIIAESIHGPHEFQRGVCTLALANGSIEPYNPTPRGIHARK